MCTVPDEAQLRAAESRLRDLIRRTPVIELTEPDLADLGVGGRVVLKLELLQHAGVFKARGALNSLLSLPVPQAGVVAASGGNHGAAIAWASQLVGVPARVYVPATSPQAKLERIAGYGAEVVVVPGFYPDALAACQEWAGGRDVLQVHAYDQPSVVAGQGTVGLELAEQVPDASTVLVPCGGGGLYAGIAICTRCPVVPVEPQLCPTLHDAVAHGRPVQAEVAGVAADSMGAAALGNIAYAVASQRRTTSLLVPDEAILAARRWLWQRLRVLAEPGGATAFAALQSGAFRPAAGSVTVVVISGGNHADLPA